MHSPLGADEPSRSTVLVVDDDSTVRSVVVDYLKASEYDVTEVGDGLQALQLAQSQRWDLLILDLMLPSMDGLEILRRVRHSDPDTPVILLTAKGTESERILGLETGADDYMTKPFSPRELVLRANTIIRRTKAKAELEPDRDVISDGDLHVDLTARKASNGDEELSLTVREFDLLAHFMSHPNQVFSRDQLMGAVWGWEIGDPSTVTVHVRRLRSKIESDSTAPQRLVTVWGTGYRWEPQKG